MASVFLFPCCEEETEYVDMTVVWTIGLETPNDAICSRAGIADVVVSLETAGDALERKGRCSDGRVDFKRIARARYLVSASGWNGEGCPVYYGEREIDPEEPGGVLETLRLESIPATGSVVVAWWFEDGRFCSYHAVDRVYLSIYRDDVNIVARELDCDVGFYRIDDAAPGRYSVRIEAQAQEGLVCREYHNLFLRPCGEIVAEGALQSCPDGYPW